jgi:hypothetical protein
MTLYNYNTLPSKVIIRSSPIVAHRIVCRRNAKSHAAETNGADLHLRRAEAAIARAAGRAGTRHPGFSVLTTATHARPGAPGARAPPCCARTRGPHFACGEQPSPPFVPLRAVRSPPLPNRLPVDRHYQRITAASCTENGGGGETGRDVPPYGTDMPSTSVTNRVCIAAGKAAKSASQYWTHRNLVTG